MFSLGAALLDRRHFEVDPRQFSVRVYDQDDVNYDSSCQVFRYGDRGFMYSINGDHGFYKMWVKPGALTSLLAQLKVRTLEGYVTRAHARLMRLALRGVGRVEIVHEGGMAGREMVWVCVRDKDST